MADIYTSIADHDILNLIFGGFETRELKGHKRHYVWQHDHTNTENIADTS